MEEQPESRQGLQWDRCCPKEKATSCQRVSAYGGATHAETVVEMLEQTLQRSSEEVQRVIDITDQLRRSAKAVSEADGC